jgi:toluene monooxygenase system protein E
VIEQLLVTYDWGEALIALDAVVKPAFDALFGGELAQLARTAGDDRLAGLLRSLGDDCAWHRAWSAALIDHAVATRPENAAAIAGWITRWWPPVLAAIDAMVPVIAGERMGTVRAAVVRAVDDHWAALPAGCHPGVRDGR